MTYVENNSSKHYVANEKVGEFLRINKKLLIRMCYMFWPLFCLFSIGMEIGEMIYNKLTNKQYENKLASWFV